MSSRYWPLVLAFGGCLAALPAAGQERSNGDKAVRLQTEETTYADPDAAKAAFDAAFWGKHTGHPETYWAICEHSQDREYADLCQQWRAANAAAEAAYWAGPQFAANIATVIGLIATIIITAIGTRAAMHAADAARETVEASKRADRAYVFVENKMGSTEIQHVIGSLTIYPTYSFPVFTFCVVNHGRTPAVISRIDAGAVFAAADTAPGYEHEIAYSVHSLAADDETLDYAVALDPPAADSLMLIDIQNGTRSLRFYVRVQFADIFGDQFTTTWYWHYNAAKQVIEPCHAAGPQYNEYNKPVKA